MNKIVRKIIFPVLFIVFLFPSVTFGSEITIRPFLIDETIAPRGDSQNLITIKSDYPHRKAILYATVNEITLDSEGEIKQFVSPVMTDRTNTVTSWIEISRGRIEIPAGETREVPLTIRLHPYAEPGEYHVFVGFVEAPNRPTAQSKAMSGDADGVIVKVTVSDERKESMRISSFLINRFVTGDDSRTINIEVENTGDTASALQGEIIFYDSRGVEVSSVDVEGSSIEPGTVGVIQSQVPLGDELGRFKANVALKYGKNQAASLYDTTMFYSMPLYLMFILFGVVLVASIFMALLFRKVLVGNREEEMFDEVNVYVRDGHDENPKDHDINLKNNS